MEKTIETLTALYNSTKSIRIFSAPNYSVLYFNNKADQQLRKEFDVAIKAGDNVSQIFEKKLRVRDFKSNFNEALKGNHITDERCIKTTNQKKWFKIEYNPVLRSDSFLGVAFSLRDVDEAKKKDLLIQQQHLLLRYILSSHSHKIRGPVANILGLVNLLHEKDLSEQNCIIINHLRSCATTLDHELKKLILEIYKTVK